MIDAKAIEAARRLITHFAEDGLEYDDVSEMREATLAVARAFLVCVERAEAAEAALAKAREIAEAAAIDLYANGLVVCAANIRGELMRLGGKP